MSFQDVCHDLEAGGRGVLPPRPPPPPPAAVVAHCIFQINTKVSDLRRLAHELSSLSAAGNPTDAATVVLRERIRRARADVTRLARNTARKLADPAAAAAVGPNLAMDFQAALKEFQWVQARIIDADRQAAARSARPSYGSPIRSSSQLINANAGVAADQQQQCNSQQMQQQQMVESRRRTQELAVLDSEIIFNEALVEEREREIRKIQQEIAEINEIFVDIAKLVRDQQGDIDVVESNTVKAAMETSKAEEQLSRAALTHETTNSSMNCLLITVLGLVMFIFALVFVAA